jgi:DNA adenine methylase
MRYPGGKGKSYPHLINLMPPHRVYIETHLGGGAVMRHKRPAPVQVGVDIDQCLIDRWNRSPIQLCDLVCADAVDFLATKDLDQHTLIYADPPYVRSTRKRTRIYKHEYSDSDHERLIAFLISAPCKVMLSGYESDLYKSLLAGWQRLTFQAKTHTCIREESVWVNFEPADRLHDVRHLGSTFREREVIRRRRTRLQARIEALPSIEQYGLLDWLQLQLGERT